MKPIIDILEEKISKAMADATGQAGCAAMIKPAAESKFGDYQANGVMAIAKQLKTNPRQLAQQIVEALDISDICLEPEIAGPGFINLRLKPEFLAKSLLEINADKENRLGVERVAPPKIIVVDFSGPNFAKQMHVGHLRSSIIGDCICRLFKFLGHEVIAQNHIGDWGTQFGMLIEHMLGDLGEENKESSATVADVHIADLEEFYRQAKTRFDSDADFADRARQAVVRLHNHDEETIKVWKHYVDESRSHCQPIYDMLSVGLHKENERGESFYAERLPGVVEELTKLGLAEESDGAICVFPEGFTNKKGNRLPFIIKKSDGAYLYATSDLAAIKYRVKELSAEKIIYVTDARQKLHFEMLFATARLAKWADENIELNHVTFGSVLGDDGKPLKTRSGENVKLSELLNEAVERARTVVQEKNPGLGEDKKAAIAKAVGIGAVKYADYSNNRTSDYIFSFDKMLAMEGNTAPYMQYAYARVKSIERKAEDKGVDIESELAGLNSLNLSEVAELDLAKHIIRYGEVIETAVVDCRCNYLTTYLYDLAQKFSSFYSSCIGRSKSRK